MTLGRVEKHYNVDLELREHFSANEVTRDGGAGFVYE